MLGIGRTVKKAFRRSPRLDRTPAIAAAPPAYEFEEDHLAVREKNLEFLADPDFVRGWSMAVEGNRARLGGVVPEVKWRAHTALWAARHGLNLEGDFVECGVFLGLFSLTICHALRFASVDKKFYLFDTFNGIPEDETGAAQRHAHNGFFECYELAQRNFAPFPNAKLVRGILPGTLSEVPLGKIAYLSMDLNHAVAERACIEALWERLSPSAIVVLDDYGWRHYEDQYETWNEFASSKNVPILSLPTGQGILIKPS